MSFIWVSKEHIHIIDKIKVSLFYNFPRTYQEYITAIL